MQTPPSPWVQRWTPLCRPGMTALDVACGPGRRMRWLAGHGCRVTGIDRSMDALQAARSYGEVVLADLETGPWPLLSQGQARTFDLVVVTHYLWRPLFPALLQSLAPGALLLYETFAEGNQAYGRPARPEFLLQPGELLQRCAGLQVIAYEHGYLPEPQRVIQRIAAFRPAATDAAPPSPPLYPLSLK